MTIPINSASNNTPEIPLSGRTKINLIIGDPVEHSLSPRMHNATYRALQLDHKMLAARVTPDVLAEALKGVRSLSINGLAVTMPHKTAVIPLLDQIDPVAKEIGAVNTVINRDGALTGYNTDWLGIVRPLERLTDLRGIGVAVIGAGGAAQAAVYGLKQSAAKVTVLNRTATRAAEVGKRFGVAWGDLSSPPPAKDFAVIINTTSVGMSNNQAREAAIDLNWLEEHLTVFETIYSPRETTLVKYAKGLGCRVIHGVEMFVEQGLEQFKIHTGTVPPEDASIREVMANAIMD
jgi:shikimate dehydrogenase